MSIDTRTLDTLVIEATLDDYEQLEQIFQFVDDESNPGLETTDIVAAITRLLRADRLRCFQFSKQQSEFVVSVFDPVSPQDYWFKANRQGRTLDG
jgi:hypothetical protein